MPAHKAARSSIYSFRAYQTVAASAPCRAVEGDGQRHAEAERDAGRGQIEDLVRYRAEPVVELMRMRNSASPPTLFQKRSSEVTPKWPTCSERAVSRAKSEMPNTKEIAPDERNNAMPFYG